jgi:hypothetical protein
LEEFPEKHAQKVKEEAPGYWKQRREQWRARFEQALAAFKKESETHEKDTW